MSSASVNAMGKITFPEKRLYIKVCEAPWSDWECASQESALSQEQDRGARKGNKGNGVVSTEPRRSGFNHSI